MPANLRNGIRVDQSEAKRTLRRAHETFLRALPTAAVGAARAAEHHARLGLLANVYGTRPGAYDRTQNLLRSVFARATVTAGLVSVEVGDTAPYASFVEYGSFGHTLTPTALLSVVEGSRAGSVIRLGRSGINWMQPGPYITPATVFARYKLHEAVEAALRRAWA